MLLGRGVGSERGLGNELGEKEPRAGAGAEQHRVLPEPAETGAHGPLALEDGAGVDVAACSESGEEPCQGLLERHQAIVDRLMVVGAARICSDPPAQRSAPVYRRGRRWRVGIGERDHGARRRQNAGDGEPPLGMALEVVHAAREPRGEPAVEKSAAADRLRRGEAAGAETERRGLGTHPFFRPHPRHLDGYGGAIK